MGGALRTILLLLLVEPCGVGGFSLIALFGGEDETVSHQDGDGGGGEPISGLIEMAGENRWRQLPGTN